MSPTHSALRVAAASIAAALVCAPFGGVGLVHLLTGRALGTGVQPAFVPLLIATAAVVLAWWGERAAAPRHDPALVDRPTRWPWAWIALLAWTLATTSFAWTAADVGLAGEARWSKGLKQFVLLAFFATTAMAVAWTVARTRGGERAQWERAASLGLLVAVLVAIWQGLAFGLALPGADALASFTSSNPSIASGSEELYLGHRFVGIPRLRGPMPEPLLFGSYLLAVLPITAAAAWRARGWSRIWRTATALLGVLCLVATFSRGAWFGAAASGALVLVGMGRGVLPRPRGRRALASGTALLLVAFAGAWLLTGRAPWQLPMLLIERIAQTSQGHDMSNLTRWWAWEAAWTMFVREPASGVGWGGFGFEFFGVAAAGADAAHFGWPVANSLPLLVLAETGAVGFALWVWALRPALSALWTARAGAGAYVVACAVAGVLVHALTHSQWNLAHLWIVGAFGAAMGNDRKDVA